MPLDRDVSFVIAERLKTLREGLNGGKGLSHQRLSAELKTAYGVDISKDSLLNYEVPEKEHPRAYKNLGMKIEYLLCLADYYGVSADYLLGRTDTPQREHTVSHDLDLSTEVISWLRSMNTDSEPDELGYIRRGGSLYRADTLFQNHYFRFLVESLCDLMDAMTAEQIFYSLPAGQNADPFIQSIIENGSLSRSVIAYLKAQAVVGGSDIPEGISDAFMFGFNVSEVVSNEVNQQLTRLIDDLRKRAATVTGDSKGV